jgi:hypothetical protein
MLWHVERLDRSVTPRVDSFDAATPPLLLRRCVHGADTR